MYTLKNWVLHKCWSSEDGEYATGFVYNNPNFTDRTYIHTSYIVKKETSDTGYKITTFSGSVYLLPFDSEK